MNKFIKFMTAFILFNLIGYFPFYAKGYLDTLESVDSNLILALLVITCMSFVMGLLATELER